MSLTLVKHELVEGPGGLTLVQHESMEGPGVPYLGTA